MVGLGWLVRWVAKTGASPDLVKLVLRLWNQCHSWTESHCYLSTCRKQCLLNFQISIKSPKTKQACRPWKLGSAKLIMHQAHSKTRALSWQGDNVLWFCFIVFNNPSQMLLLLFSQISFYCFQQSKSDFIVIVIVFSGFVLSFFQQSKSDV